MREATLPGSSATGDPLTTGAGAHPGLRIAFVAPRYHTNQHLAMKALLDSGHQVRFYALFRGQSETYDALTPDVLGLGWASRVADRTFNRRGTLDFRAAWGLPPILPFMLRLKRFRPDVLVVRNPNYAFSFLAMLSGRLLRARLVLYTQGALRRPAPQGRRTVHRALMRTFGASWITPVIGEGTPLTGAHLVPFVADLSAAPKSGGWLRDDSLRILTIGKFIPRKNHLLLLGAMARLPAIPLKLTIIGECSSADHERFLADVVAERDHLGLQDRVSIRTNVPYDAVQEEYSAHDVFVLASSREPAAVSVLEALAHGIPAICSDSNGTRYSIRPGVNGFVFRSDDGKDLERRLMEIWHRRGDLPGMGARAREVAEQEHSPEQ
ncbi:MAG TPA: glycosyltransferase family 4 protein [Longimicrobiales bacterium]|nr:glycosyltransferase family 4 protein [Longimicrobiales bacterium]